MPETNVPYLHGRCSLLLAAVLALLLPAAVPMLRAQELPVPTPTAGPTPVPVNPGLGPVPEELDRSTPWRTWTGFVEAAAAKDFERAAHFLDLGEVAPDQQSLVGPDRASKLYQLMRAVRLPEAGKLPDEPDPAPPEGGKSGVWDVKHFEHAASGAMGDVRLVRTRPQAATRPLWLIGSETVSSAGAWYRQVVERQAEPAAEAVLNAGLGPPPAGLDRSTPNRSLRNFIDAARAGRLELAAHTLYLNDLAAIEQLEAGLRLARRLKIVLDQTLWIDWDQISDQPHGKPEPSEIPADEDELGVISVRGRDYPIRLLRVTLASGQAAWVFSPQTVAAIEPLYEEYGIGPLAEWIPPPLYRRFLDVELWQWTGLGLGLVAAYLASFVLAWLLLRTAKLASRWTAVHWDRGFERLIQGPVRALVALLLLRWLVAAMRPSQPVAVVVDRVFFLLLVLLAGWLLARMVTAGSVLVEAYLAREINDPSVRRSASTRVVIVRRVANFLIGLCVTAILLMQFEVVRSIGTGLLASAGIAGLALGFAAQQTLSNVFAGIQLGVTQPVRIGDVVIFEGEWGTIEEMSLTHVVIKIWDLRRLVVPIQYLLAKPIQNWTRVSPELLGTIFVYADYGVDVEAARKAAVQIVKQSQWWDGKVEPALLVTDLKDSVVELRVMVSAANASDQWNLRCHVREKMLAWLQQSGSMPHMRLALGEDQPPTPVPGRKAPPAEAPPASATPAALPPTTPRPH